MQHTPYRHFPALGRALLRAVCALCAAVWLLAAGLTAPAQSASFREYDVKAVFLFNFAQFVEWPPQSFSSTNDPLVIGLLGRNPFGDALEQAVKGESVRGRPIEVRRLARVEETGGCHMLFVSASEASRAGEILRKLQGKPILTVGESASFVRQGGVIGFTTGGRTVGFTVNAETARKQGLHVSAQLLKLAQNKTGDR